MNIAAIDDPIDLMPIATRIRASSNFQFAWRFFTVTEVDLHSCDGVLSAFDAIIDRADLYSFLHEMEDGMEPSQLTVERLHRHCPILVAREEFLDSFARAANDRLGAYSRDYRRSTADERAAIESLFSRPGHFQAFTIRSGSQEGCQRCSNFNNHLFSNWFYDVAWDFTFFATWPSIGLFWMGCLSDTD